MKTKLNTKTIVAAVASVIGLAVYGYTSMVGYLAASATSTLPVVLTVAALVCLALRQFAGSKLPAVVNDVLLVAANVCLIGSFAVFVLARVSLAADVYFIPVNYPASEATALHISIVGAVCYLVGIVTLIVEASPQRTDESPSRPAEKLCRAVFWVPDLIL